MPNLELDHASTVADTGFLLLSTGHFSRLSTGLSICLVFLRTMNTEFKRYIKTVSDAIAEAKEKEKGERLPDLRTPGRSSESSNATPEEPKGPPDFMQPFHFTMYIFQIENACYNFILDRRKGSVSLLQKVRKWGRRRAPNQEAIV